MRAGLTRVEIASEKQYVRRILFFLPCVATPSCQTLIIISSANSKHQMPQRGATSTGVWAATISTVGHIHPFPHRDPTLLTPSV